MGIQARLQTFESAVGLVLEGPNDDFREYVARRIDELDEAAEDQVEDVLRKIESEMSRDLEVGVGTEAEPAESDHERALGELAAAESWAALASHAVAKFYAPASPWPWRKLAGWSKGVAERLQQVADLLRKPLEAIARALGASSYSIGVNFPFGVSISLSWP